MAEQELELPVEAREEWEQEEKRSLAVLVAFVNRWPNFRRHVACARLGAAIADADVMGVDVEAFLNAVRRLEPKTLLRFVPPKGS